ncbi:MAG TPA: sugar phosphate isomerase/epimerase [Opitutus sp.]|jgi:sugar phosphate isomerase/epimerase|nr:sugar phosphate isomerase/epimerase [Opitutus sp.]
MKPVPLALQTYSVREEMKADFARTLAGIGRIGYAGVELAAHRDFDQNALKTAIESAGLRVSGLLTSYAILSSDLNGVISEALHYGTQHVGCSWWPWTQYVSAAACQKIGEKLAAIGAGLRDFGIQFSFHNHAREFQLIDGRPVFDWILSAAAPRDLLAEPDVFWVHQGGYSPARFLREKGDRCRLIHLKDEKEIGGGPVDFAEVFAAAESIGAVEWYIVEQERYSGTPLEGVAKSFEQLKRWGKA